MHTKDKKMTAVILAAGYATKLYPLTENLPVALLDVGGRTILSALVDNLSETGMVDQIVIASNHKFASLFEDFASSRSENIRIVDDGTVTSDTRLGAVRDLELAVRGSSLGVAHSYEPVDTSGGVLVMASDNLLSFPIAEFLKAVCVKDCSGVMCYEEPDIVRRRRTGIVTLDDNGFVSSYEEKPAEPKGLLAVPPFYFFTEHDIGMLSMALRDGCDAEAPGSFAAWLSSKVPVYGWMMTGDRHEIGNRAALELQRATWYESRGDQRAERHALAQGLASDPFNYEMYYMLGLMYENTNVNQAWLCFERSAHYCMDEDDLEIIHMQMHNCEMRAGFDVRNLSFMILSYNDMDIMKACLAAIRDECREQDEIVVVDNASTDGVAEWLREQTYIRLIESGDNVGFVSGSNLGVMACNEDNDLLLINNDAILTPGALFWMRMALYEDRGVGAAGPVSNNALEQNVNLDGVDYYRYGVAHNIPMDHPYETRIRLTGFCILLRREAVDQILMTESEEGDSLLPDAARKLVMKERGKHILFDPIFAPAYFEDDDLGIRLTRAGFRNLLCHNAFVYHLGGDGSGTSFNSATVDQLEKSRHNFKDKWGFDIWEYEGISDEFMSAVAKVAAERYDGQGDTKGQFIGCPLRIFELGCGFGANLSALHYKYPYSYLAGVEHRTDIAGLGIFMGDVFSGNFDEMEIPYPKGFFDIINIYDALSNAQDPEALAQKILYYLAEGGTILASKGSTDHLPENVRVVEM